MLSSPKVYSYSEKIKKKSKAYKNENSNLKGEVHKLNEQNQSLRKKSEINFSTLKVCEAENEVRMEFLKQENVELVNHFKLLEHDYYELQRHIEFLKKDYAIEKENFQKKINEKNNEMDDLERKYSTLEAENAIIKTKMLKKTEMHEIFENEFKNNKSQFDVLLKDNEKLKMKNSHLKKELEERQLKINNVNLFVSELKNSLDKKTVENNELISYNNELKRSFDNLYNQMSNAEQNKQDHLMQENYELALKSTNNEKLLKEHKDQLNTEKNLRELLEKDIKNILIMIESDSDKLPNFLELKSNSSDLNYMKNMLSSILQQKRKLEKQVKKSGRAPDFSLRDLNLLSTQVSPTKEDINNSFAQNKIRDLQTQLNRKIEELEKVQSDQNSSPTICNPFTTKTEVEPYKRAIPSKLLGEEMIDKMTIIIGILIQIILRLDTKHSEKTHLNPLINYTLDYFLNMHQKLANSCSEITLLSPRKKPIIGRLRKKLRKHFLISFFCSILFCILKKRRIFEKNPNNVFLLNIQRLPKKHLLNLANNKFYFINNNYFTEIRNLFLQSNKLETLMTEILDSGMKNFPRLIRKNISFDLNHAKNDFFQLEKVFAKINCMGEKENALFPKKKKEDEKSAKVLKEMEVRINSLVGENRELKRSLEKRSLRLEELERRSGKK